MDIYKRYFIYSQQHAEEEERIKAKINKKAKFGTVMVGGIPKKFTDIVLDPSKLRYTDGKVLISGDIRKIRYTEPER